MTWPTIYDTQLGEYNAMELPGQQLAATNAKTPLDYLLNLDIKAAAGCQRLTGIMASIALLFTSESAYNLEVMEKMMAAGMNIAFLNMAFGSREVHVETIKMLKEAKRNHSIVVGKNYPLSIAIRLSGRKIRTGKISETYGETVEIKTGDALKLTIDETYRDRCSAQTVYVDFMYLPEQLKKNDMVLLDNETIEIQVEIVAPTSIICLITRGGILGSYKDVFVPNVVLKMPYYSEKDKLDIEMAIENHVDIIIPSFVNNSASITELKSILGDKGKNIAIMANIQTLEGFRNYDNILEVSDGILLSRQELGSDITPKKLVIAQKNLVARANQANVPVCICAQLLSSMARNKIPLRSEILDIANCILDGADCLALGYETAVGLYPVETVACMSSACKEAETCIWTHKVFSDIVEMTPLPCDQISAIAMAGVLVSQRCIAAAIIVTSTSGKTAQIVSKYRPRCPIITLTRYPAVAKKLHLFRGIIPLIFEETPNTNWALDLEKRVNFGVKFAIERGFMRVGDPVILICSWRQGSGFTNTMKVVYVAADSTVHV